jgi:hypothetical protein
VRKKRRGSGITAVSRAITPVLSAVRRAKMAKALTGRLFDILHAAESALHRAVTGQKSMFARNMKRPDKPKAYPTKAQRRRKSAVESPAD